MGLGGDPAHLHLRPLLVVAAAIGDFLRAEVRPGDAVDVVEGVEDEGGGHAAGVVVGGLDDRGLLDPVDSEQEVVVRPHVVAQVREEVQHVGGGEVADGAAEEHHELGNVPGDAGDGVLEAGFEPGEREFREQFLGHALGRHQGGGAHVYRGEGAPAAGPAQGLEQMDGLPGEAGAEFHDAFHRRQAHQRARLALEDGRLGAGRVILGQLADLLEQQRPSLVVQVAGFEPPRAVEQGPDDSGGELAGGALAGGQDRWSRDAPVGAVASGEDICGFTVHPVQYRERQGFVHQPRAGAATEEGPASPLHRTLRNPCAGGTSP